ncbi:hypothetical protein C9374_002159 [Naegleria lovaniensis]|uniref:TLC domain-containing protein n=1 Tax=Naegleria lovaniensis TaxID=51637 RepID=A0AA88GWP5_NAELO|nr:uncharacterized protein C9374_002159 [Naegleria lovaniensis]KAG2387124.1 hypothetical protein C9374_002159 [Naegleria lovaniensis]
MVLTISNYRIKGLASISLIILVLLFTMITIMNDCSIIFAQSSDTTDSPSPLPHLHGHHHDHFKTVNPSTSSSSAPLSDSQESSSLLAKSLIEDRKQRKESLFTVSEHIQQSFPLIKPMTQYGEGVFEEYVRTALISYACFTVAYFVFRILIIPLLLKFGGPSYLEYFEKNITLYEQAHHSQVVLSFIHAVIATVGSYFCTIHLFGLDMLHFGLESALNQPYDLEIFKTRHTYIALTLGYFVADLTFYFFNHIHPFSPNRKSLREVYLSMKKQALGLDLLHHYISCIAYIFFFSLNAGSFLIISFEINEVSTPFLHVRYFARQWKQTNKWWYHLNQGLFVLTFFLSRIVYNGILMCFVLWSRFTLGHFTSFGQLILYYLVQLLWWFAIMKIILNKIRGAEKHKEE